MYPTLKISIFCCFLVCSVSCLAQSTKSRALLYHLTREDQREYLLYQSKQQKTKAIGAAIAGPLLSGIGLYLMDKENKTSWRNESPAKTYGALLSSVGFVVSVSSIPLFISSGKLKRNANLLFKAGSVSPVNSRWVPEAGVRINF